MVMKACFFAAFDALTYSRGKTDSVWTVLEDYEHCSSCFRETYNLSDNTGQDMPCAPPYSFYHFKSPLPAVGWAGLAALEFLPPALWGGAWSRCYVAYSCSILMHCPSERLRRKKMIETRRPNFVFFVMSWSCQLLNTSCSWWLMATVYHIKV